MWFYTGKGDEGETNLFDGSRISKDDPRLEFIGTIDELNALIGLIILSAEYDEVVSDLKHLQTLLSKMMGAFAGAGESSLFGFGFEEALMWLEDRISSYGGELSNPKSFTFPGDSSQGVYCDLCRTKARRVERLFYFTEQQIQIDNKDVDNASRFFNRLSSFFYILRLFYEQK